MNFSPGNATPWPLLLSPMGDLNSEVPLYIYAFCAVKSNNNILIIIIHTRQVTRATHAMNRVCPRVELILKNHNYIANYISRIY